MYFLLSATAPGPAAAPACVLMRGHDLDEKGHPL